MPGEIAKFAMMFGFMKMQIDSRAMNVVPMRVTMNVRFHKWNKKYQQRENGDRFFQFLHG